MTFIARQLSVAAGTATCEFLLVGYGFELPFSFPSAIGISPHAVESTETKTKLSIFVLIALNPSFNQGSTGQKSVIRE